VSDRAIAHTPVNLRRREGEREWEEKGEGTWDQERGGNHVNTHPLAAKHMPVTR